MSDKKYSYLIEQWEKFESKIQDKELNKIDNCFNDFITKIKNNNFSLEDYANPTENECSYFCNFMERTSAKSYGSARPGNMYNYGISYIADEKKYFIQPSLLDDIQKKVGIKYKKENKKQEFIYDKEFTKNIFTEKIVTYLKKIIETDSLEEKFNLIESADRPINATHLLRKLVSMHNNGEFLFIYADEAIDTIYDFFVGEDKTKGNIEKNYEATLRLKDIFKNIKSDNDNIYIIKLSRFIWSIFGSTITLESKNMILHGAPGTGKTYSVKNTVKNIILKQGGSLEEQLVFTQFHPSYGYEDFIDGIKPSGIENGQMHFELKNGNFKELCRIATQKLKEERKIKTKDTDLSKFFFVADEINRAELSRVFGELLICLEEDYRIDFDINGNIINEENLILTQNSMLDINPVYKKGDTNYFGVPINLYFIGTMNDIDKSVDSFDMALRRRFYWKEIRCNYSFIDSLFNNSEYTTICKKLNRYITGYKEEKINGKYEKSGKINTKEPLRLGISYELGHAYFKNLNSITNKEINNLWESKLEPLLKEYLRAEYSQDEVMEKLSEAKDIFKLSSI